MPVPGNKQKKRKGSSFTLLGKEERRKTPLTATTRSKLLKHVKGMKEEKTTKSDRESVFERYEPRRKKGRGE